MARKPSALARELLRNFPKGKRRRKRRSGDGGSQKSGKSRRPAGGATPDEATDVAQPQAES
jgi:hypothetical protein